jgi:phospholipid/cholesterol/gamma-HCH transport system substrate-binding protein
MRMKNEVTVGIVVILAIVLLIGSAFWLSGRRWGDEQTEIVSIFVEVGELREGNPVKYRGVQVGRVTRISLSATGEGVLVTMSVSADLAMPIDPAVLLAPASLFGDWQASIVSQSVYPELEFITTRTPGVLPGSALPDITQLTAVGARIAGDIETLAGRVELAFTEETALKIRETIDNVQTMSEQLTGFVDQQTRTYAAVGENVLSTTQNVQMTAQRVDRIAGEVEGAFQEGGEVRQILANARMASENLQQLSIQLQGATAGIPALVARVDTTLTSISLAATGFTGIATALEPQVAEIGPTIAEAREALATLRRAAARIEDGEGTLGRLMEDPALYEETQAAVATLRRVLADLQANPARYIGAVRIF